MQNKLHYIIKKDVDPQGNKCIGIYLISDAQLIFQSKAIENDPFLVEIIEKELIAGFSSNFNIYSVVSGENAFIKSYGPRESSPNCPNNNQVYCWGSKDKLETLKGDGQAN